MISKASAYWSIFEKTRIVLNSYKKYASGNNLLDVGCGTKPFYGVFKGQVKNYIGVDIPSNMVRHDQKERVETIDIYMDCLNLAIKNSSIDTVFSSFVIEHIFEYERVFTEVYRVIKKGGFFIMVSPLVSEIHEEPYDYFRFTNYSIELIAERHGFKTVKILPVGGGFLIFGNRIVAHMHKWLKFLNSNRFIELSSFLVQKVTLYLDNRFPGDRFVCNYLSILQKRE